MHVTQLTQKTARPLTLADLVSELAGFGVSHVTCAHLRLGESAISESRDSEFRPGDEPFSLALLTIEKLLRGRLPDVLAGLLL